MSGFVFVAALLSSALFLFFFELTFTKIIAFFLGAILSTIYSLLVGASLALLAKNQMSIGPVTAPISMALGLLPMFAQMNKNVDSIAKFMYSYYAKKIFENLELNFDTVSIVILFLNFFFLIAIFVILYRKCGLDKNK